MKEADDALFNYTTIAAGSEIGEVSLQNWILIVYFAVIGSGSVIDLLNAVALLRCRRNGTLSLILQISLVDAASFYLALTEVRTVRNKIWFLPPEVCPLFKGLEVLINSLIIYQIVCFNFHIISLWNLHESEVRKRNKNPLTSCQDDSNECLVTKQEAANRIVTIDYRKRKNDVAIIFPTIFVWFLSLSLSVPNFTLSSTLNIGQNNTICAVIDIYYGQILQILLVVFEVVIPSVLLMLSFFILLVKLKHTTRNDIDNVLTKKFDEIRILLIFAIIVTVAYFTTSFQRQVTYFIHVSTHSIYDEANKFNSIKMPPLYNNHLKDNALLYLSLLHYSGGTIRGLLSLGILPRFRSLVKNKIGICFRHK